MDPMTANTSAPMNPVTGWPFISRASQPPITPPRTPTTIVGRQPWTLREVFTAHQGKEISTTGDGFFVGFDSPEQAVAAAVAIQRRLAEHRQKAGFAPPIRIGIHAADANQVGENFRGRGVHEASRIAALAKGNEIIARVTTAGDADPTSAPRSELLKGFTGTLLFSPQPPPKYTIGWQSLDAATDAPCSSDITVQPAAP